ncbi:dicarboxylate/amino acid:cation symporter [uncultured Muribaculum sp.]|uniref:dicarboxylate/amino acid:cation symporter n=1 Tax=uncultured Muribaculum sp. TaxID=1918613 RepID=UPI00259A7BDB|nr:dicarboxylate/amino acid:cation symporter [uncultured Muribaculum sp.]
MKKFKPGLLIQILAAIALGIAIGYVMPVWAAGIFMTFNSLFSQLLGFLVPLIIVGFVTPAIAEIGNRAGKVLLLTAAIAYIATVSSGLLSYFTAEATFPNLITPHSLGTQLDNGHDIEPYFTVSIPPLFGVMTALVLAFMTGIGIAYGKGTVLKRGAEEFRDIVAATIRTVIIPLLPIYIFGIFLNMTMSGQVASVLSSFLKIIGIIFLMAAVILILQYCIAALFVKRNPFKLLLTMLPAYFTALGTQSSAATIPVTLRQAIKMGVSEEIAGFVIPLCATIHMSGSTLKIVMCALALMIMQGLPYDLPMFAGFIAMLAITIIAAPGIPGGAIMASLGLLGSMLGFNEQDQALMIALYIAMDSFGTACNVTGDGFIALIVDKFFGKNHPATR